MLYLLLHFMLVPCLTIIILPENRQTRLFLASLVMHSSELNFNHPPWPFDFLIQKRTSASHKQYGGFWPCCLSIKLSRTEQNSCWQWTKWNQIFTRTSGCYSSLILSLLHPQPHTNTHMAAFSYLPLWGVLASPCKQPHLGGVTYREEQRKRHPDTVNNQWWVQSWCPQPFDSPTTG